ncbi:hypothetical protein FXF51_16470 [Nonomuraea sp. PA05]|uniref:WD40 repeat domain-containing protein n=1 Tax=Nonomuraea sp. PA05 TaxID=2604466 RepID=UPI0011D748B7|nr:hypothetical protein [Nonomuraea sp. PA05]TYB66690.1 hypothetical protein FXF51_16470 [Nonomuraea sp. PA05]
MRTSPSVVLAGLALALLSSACADPATDRVALVGAPSPSSSTTMPPEPGHRTTGPAVHHPYPPATSLADPMATGAPLAPTGEPRFFVSAGAPVARFPRDSKTAGQTPVKPAVHDAETGEFVADVPLPPGVESSWHLVAAARDNRTFAIAGWTGRRDPAIVFFLVRLGEDGRPGEPVAVTQTGPDELRLIYDLALSADGTRLAYATPLLGGGAKISVLDVATGRRRDWTTKTHSMVSGLSWAPDGRSLAYVTGGRAIAVLDLTRAGTVLEGATSRTVMNAEGVRLIESVAHTPDGAALIYAAGHTVERVAVSGGPARVLARPELPPGASLSLRFSVEGTGEHLLYVHGGRAHRVTLADGTATSVPIAPQKGEPPRAAW